MGNSESRSSPGEDRHRGSHGGDKHAEQSREPGASTAAPEDRVIRGPRRNPVSDGGIDRRPPNSQPHDRGSRVDDPAADSVMPGREFGAGGGVDDGPNEAGGDASRPRPP